MQQLKEPMSVLASLVTLIASLIVVSMFIYRSDWVNDQQDKSISRHKLESDQRFDRNEAVIRQNSRMEGALNTQTEILKRVESNQKEFKNQVVEIQKDLTAVQRSVDKAHGGG